MSGEDGSILVDLSESSSSEAALSSTSRWTPVTAITSLACPPSPAPRVRRVAMW
jgi:hypothetical protein